MKRGGPKNIVASVQARLVERSRELGVEHQLTLARFGGERLLYRMSKSEFADRFILKGAALLLLWPGEPIRPTKDIDLLGFGDTSAEALKRLFVSLCAREAPEDGLTFLPESVQVEAIREDQEYGGMRVKLMAMLGNVRIPLQIDVGAGDAVVPPPEVLDFPGLLDLPIGIHPAGRGVVVYVVTDPWLDEFRVFLLRHAALLQPLPAWTLRIVVPPQFPDIGQRGKQVVWNQLMTPLKTDVLNELRRYFEQARAHPAPSRSDDLDERFYQARDDFAEPRFKALYRVWKEDGEAVFAACRSHRLDEAVTDGAGRVETLELGHRYGHLSPLVTVA